MAPVSPGSARGARAQRDRYSGAVFGLCGARGYISERGAPRRDHSMQIIETTASPQLALCVPETVTRLLR